MYDSLDTIKRNSILLQIQILTKPFNQIASLASVIATYYASVASKVIVNRNVALHLLEQPDNVKT